MQQTEHVEQAREVKQSMAEIIEASQEIAQKEEVHYSQEMEPIHQQQVVQNEPNQLDTEAAHVNETLQQPVTETVKAEHVPLQPNAVHSYALAVAQVIEKRIEMICAPLTPLNPELMNNEEANSNTLSANEDEEIVAPYSTENEVIDYDTADKLQ